MSDERPGWHRHPNGGGWVEDTATVDETAPPPVPPWPDGVLRDAANRLRWIANSGYIEDPGIKRIIRSWADELDATLVPPWPGAVLSGLVDEDGVPTWLAQAGQVRGEAVRLRHRDDEWATWATLDGDEWVEVRAPRAAPEPETERVPWWEAVGRRWPDGRTVWKVTHSVEGVIAWDNGGEALDVMFSADGTVEVLKDGDR